MIDLSDNVLFDTEPTMDEALDGLQLYESDPEKYKEGLKVVERARANNVSEAEINKKIIETEERIKENQERFTDDYCTLKVYPQAIQQLESLLKPSEEKDRLPFGREKSIKEIYDHIMKIDGGDKRIRIDDYQLEQTSLVKQRHKKRFKVFFHKDFYPDYTEVFQQWTELNRAEPIQISEELGPVELDGGWGVVMIQCEGIKESD